MEVGFGDYQGTTTKVAYQVNIQNIIYTSLPDLNVLR
jgi:hypothetical protein